MSNYLNHLVARQLDRAGRVRPRLPSLFEPQAHTGTPPHGQSDAIGPLAVEAVGVESEIGARPQTRRSIETRTDSTSSRSHSANDEAAGTVWRGRQQIALSSWQSAGPAPDAAGEASSRVAATQTRASLSPPTATQTDAASITPLAPAAPEEAAPPRQNVRRPSPQPAAAIERQGEANGQTVSPRLKPSTIDAAPTDSTKGNFVVQPRAVSLVDNRREGNDPSLRAQSPASGPAPVINVTIGRIEVRATAASDTPRRSEPSAKPLMSLDEYLRRRTKGGGE